MSLAPLASRAALVLLLSTLAFAPARAMVMSNTIVVTNSGSTNFIGYRVAIGPGGQASFVTGAGSGHARLPKALFRRLKRDIAAAMPLSALPQPAICMKSMSFGTSSFVALGGERSPDLTCPGNGAARALARDVAKLVSALKISAVLRSEGTALPPQNF